MGPPEKKPPHEKMGKRLTGILDAKGLSVDDLVRDLQFKKATVYSWLGGWRRPSVPAAGKLASYLEVSLAYIFCHPVPRLDRLGDKFELVAATSSLDTFLDKEQAIPTAERDLYEQILASPVAPRTAEGWRALTKDVLSAARQFEIQRGASIEAMTGPQAPKRGERKNPKPN
jgi:transcriptional regulator with XRE-family HTH domain